jgi:hypothetical protein
MANVDKWVGRKAKGLMLSLHASRQGYLWDRTQRFYSPRVHRTVERELL